MAQALLADAEAARELVGPAQDILARSPHPKIRQIVEYWRAIAPADALPGRQHFDPAAVPGLLANLWILDVERAPAPRFRYRLVGTSVARAFDKDLTGLRLDRAHPGFERSAIHGYLSEVVEKRLPAWRVGRPKFFALQDFLRVERVYLPAARDGAHVDMIFALTVFLDRHGREF
jgi:hypothetical protein